MASNVRFLDQIPIAASQGGSGNILDIYYTGSLFKSNVTEINFSGSAVRVEEFNGSNVTIIVDCCGSSTGGSSGTLRY
jgi:hypothetical protein